MTIKRFKGTSDPSGGQILCGADGMSIDSYACVDETSSYGSDSVEDEEMEDVFQPMDRPFDMGLLGSCIERGSQILESVKGKDVVIVLGKTGAGKSTFIQGIAGKKMCTTKHSTTYFGNTVDKHVYEVEDPMPNFEIGHDKCSKTRFVNGFTHKAASQRELVYLDSPGFEDTNGCEVDIATSVVLGQVAKVCRSLRFVMLVNCSLLDDRGEAIRLILKMAGTFVRDFFAGRISTQSCEYLFGLWNR